MECLNELRPLEEEFPVSSGVQHKRGMKVSGGREARYSPSFRLVRIQSTHSIARVGRSVGCGM